MAYYVGDIPAEDLVIEPARSEEPIDLAPFDALDSTVVLRDFDGLPVDADFLLSFDNGTVVVEWPTDASPFATPGLYTLAVTLIGTERRERLAPVYIVAQQDDDGWHTLDTARDEWESARSITDARLFQILAMAQQQVVAFAPALEPGQRPPLHYRAGQLDQARNLLNSALVDPANGSTAGDDFVLKPYPLDWIIKQQLRPKQGVPKVG